MANASAVKPDKKLYPDPKTFHHPIEEVEARAKTGDPNAQRALGTRAMLISRGIAKKQPRG